MIDQAAGGKRERCYGSKKSAGRFVVSVVVSLALKFRLFHLQLCGCGGFKVAYPIWD